MTRARRLLILLCVLLATVGLDQVTKAAARLYLAGENSYHLLGGVFTIHYAENPGAFLSLGADLPPAVQTWIFVVGVSVILAGLALFLIWEVWREGEALPGLVLIALALFLGGGVGNLIDRLLYQGRVADFMVIRVGGLSTGVFNVADMALMVAVGLILFSMWAERGRHHPAG